MKKLFISTLMFGIVQISLAQHFDYTYDDAGNRILRSHTQLRVTEVPRDPIQADDVAGHEIKMYPNPTTGVLVVSISNFSDVSQSKMEIYDISGKMVFKKQSLNELTNIDLSKEKNGNYFLKIFIDEKMKQYKVVKTE